MLTRPIPLKPGSAPNPNAPGPDVAPSAQTQISQAGELRSSRVESLRALAALAVVQGHVYGSAHGYLPLTAGTFPRRILFGGGFGVFVFFALSGYLLFWPFVRRDYGDGSSLRLGRYALNRVLRILPLYYVTVIILLLVQEHGGSGMQWLRFMTWSETFSRQTFEKVDPAVWSLVVELHFYILLPLLAWGLSRLSRGSARVAAVVLVVLGAGSYAVWLLEGQQSLWHYQLPATFYFFVPGMLIALLRSGWRAPVQPARLDWLLRSDTWVIASLGLWLLVFWHYTWTPAVAAASFLIVAACVLPLAPGRLIRALEWRPLAVLGIASYSLYLWHMPLIRWITGSFSGAPSYGYLGLAIRVFPAACALALLSYAVIESPFLRLRRRWSPASPAQALDPAPATA